MSRKRPLGVINIEIFDAFLKILKRFTKSNRFDMNLYRMFFFETEGNEIIQFFNEIQQFVIDVVYHIVAVEGGRNFFTKYFMDLSILLAGNMQTAFRSAMIDNTRTKVDVSQFDFKEILQDMKRLSDHFSDDDRIAFIIPNDCSLLYNIADYTVSIFDIKSREFDIPHMVEVKRITNPVEISADQRERIKRQVQSMKRSAIAFNLQMNHDLFNSRDLYLSTFEDVLRNHFNRMIENGLIQVDHVFSICTGQTGRISINSKEKLPLFNEMHFGNIIPFLFRGVDLGLFFEILEANYEVYIGVDLLEFKEALRGVTGFNGFEKGNSLRKEFVEINNQQINLAGLVNLKIPVTEVVELLSDPDFYNRTAGPRISTEISHF